MFVQYQPSDRLEIMSLEMIYLESSGTLNPNSVNSTLSYQYTGHLAVLNV